MISVTESRKQMNRVLALLVCAICGFHQVLAADLGAASYLSRLQEALSGAVANMPAVTKSAEEAAGDFLSGGKLWATGRQADFVSEACGRLCESFPSRYRRQRQ